MEDPNREIHAMRKEMVVNLDEMLSAWWFLRPHPAKHEQTLIHHSRIKKPGVKSIRVVHTRARATKIEEWRRYTGEAALAVSLDFRIPAFHQGWRLLHHYLTFCRRRFSHHCLLPCHCRKPAIWHLVPCLLQMQNSHPPWLSQWAWTLLTDSSTKFRHPQSCLFHPWAEW